jgi:hypothetical protein
MKLRHLLSLFALGLCTAAFATPILDQVNNANPANGFSYIYVTPQFNWSQSFQQSAGNISGGGFLLGSYWGNGTETFTIGVYSADPSVNPGSLLASGTVTGTSGNWVDAFWNPINVAPNTTLYLGITSATYSYFATTYSSGNTYALGSVSSSGTANTNFDLGFRTYSDDSASVPDSGSTLVMMAGSVLGLVAIGRRFGSNRA